MNWLIYIAGFCFGWAIFNGLINADGFLKYKGIDIATIVKLTIWSMMWVWICWKFIR